MARQASTPTLDRFAELLGCSRSAIREAMILAANEKGFPGSGIVNIHVRVPIKGDRPREVRPGSMIHRTAKHLHIDPDELQDALLALRPDAAPGTSATFGLRAQVSLRDLILPELPYAEDAAERGNRWAAKWLDLARRIMSQEGDE